jgi:hypothetical protein
VQAFPLDIQQDVLVLLQNRTVEFWRYCGGELPQVLGLEEWMVFKTIINDLEFAAKRLGRTCADDSWKRQVAEPSLSQDSERDLFLQRIHEESDVPVELLKRLWADERIKIKAVATSNFDERLAELKLENRNQFEALWKSRVYVPARLHDEALEGQEAGLLRDQLRELLYIHLAQDLVPNALKRMHNKGLVRDQPTRKQVDKLQAAVAAEKKDPCIMKSLNKLHEKLGFAALTPDELVQARNQQLVDLVKGMDMDTDDPRLFLTTVIVLFASKQKTGIIYATGKFAPRLLKLLKADLDEEQYKSLERLKYTVKAGNVSGEDRQEMRHIAAGAFKELTDTSAEADSSERHENESHKHL